MLSACAPEIQSFEECVAAGNAVRGSFPRQCRTEDGRSFTEDQLIGGQRDEHGCLGPAGYSYDEEIAACIRTWELDAGTRRAAQIAVSGVASAEQGLTLLSVEAKPCDGCFTVMLEKKDGTRAVSTLENWELVESVPVQQAQ